MRAWPKDPATPRSTPSRSGVGATWVISSSPTDRVIINGSAYADSIIASNPSSSVTAPGPSAAPACVGSWRTVRQPCRCRWQRSVVAVLGVLGCGSDGVADKRAPRQDPAVSTVLDQRRLERRTSVPLARCPGLVGPSVHRPTAAALLSTSKAASSRCWRRRFGSWLASAATAPISSSRSSSVAVRMTPLSW